MHLIVMYCRAPGVICYTTGTVLASVRFMVRENVEEKVSGIIYRQWDHYSTTGKSMDSADSMPESESRLPAY